MIGTESTPSVISIAKSPEESAKGQREEQRASEALRIAGNTFWITTFLTGALALIAFFQLLTYKDQIHATTVIERAYIDMAHQPPGITFASWNAVVIDETYGVMRDVQVTVNIRNVGHTPAKVTARSVEVYISPSLPPIPPYAPPDRVRIHLVTNKKFKIEGHFARPLTVLNEVTGTSPQQKLFVIGYVDYMDKFGRRFRVGYGRVYAPWIDDAKLPAYWPEGVHSTALFTARNNLPFIEVPGYNYDRPRKQGEGNDWNEGPEE